MEQEHQDDKARGEPATASTRSTTTKGGTQRPAGPDGLGGPGSQKLPPGTPPRRPTHAVHSVHPEPATHEHTNHDPGTAGTTGPLGGETIRGGATRRQLEQEPDQTPSQRTDYSTTSRTASTVTRQRTPSQDRTEYSQNTNYSHITRGGTYSPGTGPEPVTARGLQRPNHELNHKRHAVQAYTKPPPHGVQRPRHGPLQHASPRSAATRQPGQLSGTGTTNGDNGCGDNTAKRA